MKNPNGCGEGGDSALEVGGVEEGGGGWWFGSLRRGLLWDCSVWSRRDEIRRGLWFTRLTKDKIISVSWKTTKSGYLMTKQSHFYYLSQNAAKARLLFAYVYFLQVYHFYIDLLNQGLSNLYSMRIIFSNPNREFFPTFVRQPCII